MRNVARTWAFETGQLIGMDMSPTLPYNDYYEYFAPDYELDVKPSNMDNANSNEYLEKIKNSVIENLRRTAAPSQQMMEVPRDPLLNGMDEEAEDEADDLDADENTDVRYTQRQMDKQIEREDEFEESEDEDANAAMSIRRQPDELRRRNRITDFPNMHADADIDIDDDGNEYMTSGINGEITMGDGSREENRRIADEKADAALSPSPDPKLSPSPLGDETPANGDFSKRSSPEPETVEDDGDVEDMDIDEDDPLAKEEDDDEEEPTDGDIAPPAPNRNEPVSTTLELPQSSAMQSEIPSGSTSAARPATEEPNTPGDIAQPTPSKSPSPLAQPNHKPQPGVQDAVDTAEDESDDVEMAELDETDVAKEICLKVKGEEEGGTEKAVETAQEEDEL